MRTTFDVFHRHRASVDVVATSEVSVSLTIDDASALMKDPAGEAARIAEGFPELAPWRRAIAETALRRAAATAAA